jgi:hypothetical protein
LAIRQERSRRARPSDDPAAGLNIAAAATDSDGTIVRVEFFRGDGATKLGEDSTAPYSYRWKNAPSGSHVLRVKAHDNGGAVTTSGPVRITARPR